MFSFVKDKLSESTEERTEKNVHGQLRERGSLEVEYVYIYLSFSLHTSWKKGGGRKGKTREEFNGEMGTMTSKEKGKAKDRSRFN